MKTSSAIPYFLITVRIEISTRVCISECLGLGKRTDQQGRKECKYNENTGIGMAINFYD